MANPDRNPIDLYRELVTKLEDESREALESGDVYESNVLMRRARFVESTIPILQKVNKLVHEREGVKK